MRILIYGFGPYRQFHDNVTEKIVRGFPKWRGLKKIVFPVRFDKGQFTSAVRDFRPDIVLGLGQCSKGRLLRQERRAVNRRRNSANQRPRSIARTRPQKLFTNLNLKLARYAKSSQDAGSYVCNFSMYVMLDYINRRKLPIHYGFVHIPCGYDPKKASSLLRRALAGSMFNVQGSRF